MESNAVALALFLAGGWDAVDEDDYPQESPVLAVEVHSPGSTKPKMWRKVELYLEHGAEQCWVVYPKHAHGETLPRLCSVETRASAGKPTHPVPQSRALRVGAA